MLANHNNDKFIVQNNPKIPFMVNQSKIPPADGYCPPTVSPEIRTSYTLPVVSISAAEEVALTILKVFTSVVVATIPFT